MSSEVPTTVECFGLRIGERGELLGRVVRVRLEDDPDEVAAAAIGLTDSGLDGTAVLHSTSWRWHRGVGIVLTYVCAPDPLAAEVHDDAHLVAPAHGHPHEAAGPSRPGDGQPSPAQVLHHAIDHLAWLADHHPGLIDESRRVAPALWTSVLGAGRHRAGRFPSLGAAEPGPS